MSWSRAFQKATKLTEEGKALFGEGYFDTDIGNPVYTKCKNDEDRSDSSDSGTREGRSKEIKRTKRKLDTFLDERDGNEEHTKTNSKKRKKADGAYFLSCFVNQIMNEGQPGNISKRESCEQTTKPENSILMESMKKQICRTWLKHTFLGIGQPCPSDNCPRTHKITEAQKGKYLLFFILFNEK